MLKIGKSGWKHPTRKMLGYISTTTVASLLFAIVVVTIPEGSSQLDILTVKKLLVLQLSLVVRTKVSPHNQAIKYAPCGRRTSFHSAAYCGRYMPMKLITFIF